MKQKKQLKGWVTAAISLFIFMFLALFLFQCVFHLSRVTSSSMEPTINTKSIVLVNRLAYKKKSPKRGDVIIFYEEGNLTLKRIIGLPGEKVSFSDGNVFINDTLLKEPYLKEGVETNTYESFQVPKESYFVLGDNRENSIDSRYQLTTYVKKPSIVGRAFYQFDHWTPTELPRYNEKN